MLSTLKKIKPTQLRCLIHKNYSCLSITKPLCMKTIAAFAAFRFRVSYGLSQYTHHKNTFKTFHEGEGFKLQQILTGCLAIYSYYIESGD